MGVAVYPIIEGCDEPWATTLFSKAIARNQDHFTKALKKSKTETLDEFYRPDEEAIAEFGLEEEEAEWFEPNRGLIVIAEMLRIVDSKPQAFEVLDMLKEDLEKFNSVLLRAKAEGRRWNLGLSY